MKKCNKCGKEKELDCFYNTKHTIVGKLSYCIECVRSYQKERYANLTPEQKELFALQNIKNRIIRTTILNNK